MADKEQLTILEQGIEIWNAWREKDPDKVIDLSGADLQRTDLSGVKASNYFFLDASDDFNAYMSEKSKLLHAINLSKANLKEINFRWARLTCANLMASDLRDAELMFANLDEANLSEADLSRANLFQVRLENASLDGAKLRQALVAEASLKEAILSNADLQEADFRKAELEYADLKDANIRLANFQEANLQEADFSNADLRGTNFAKTRVLKTNFNGAKLTGACIADWQIGSSTDLSNVSCEYIFRTFDQETGRFSGRLPVDPNSIFAPGEFTQRFQIIASALETIDITFTEGVDWQAFFQSFQELRYDRPNEDISIQGMERKGGAFVVRFEVNADSDKAAAIETRLKQLYISQLAILEAQYEERLRLQGIHLEDARRTIEMEKQEKSTLMGIMATMAQNQGPKYDQRGSTFGSFVDTAESGSKVQSIQHNYASPEKQDLAAAAAEIQRLLKQLEESNPSATEAEKSAFVSAAIPPGLKQRVVGALQSGGKTALEELLDNPYINIALAIIEGWREA